MRNRKRTAAALLACAVMGQAWAAFPAAAAEQEEPEPVVQTETLSHPRYLEPEDGNTPEEKPESAPEPSKSPAPSVGTGTVTPTAGTGTVLENSTKTAESREFFTVECEGGGVYYLVVDKQKTGGNVYFLKEVTEQDLAGLAKKTDPDGTKQEAPVPEGTAPPSSAAPVESAPQSETARQPDSGTGQAGKNTVFFIISAAAAAAGAGAWYFLVRRPSQEMKDAEDFDSLVTQEEDPEEEPFFREDEETEESGKTDDGEGGDIFL